MTRKDADLHGVVVIDKPVGPTSHDVIVRLRRTLQTRAVGHAGTLDPAASGVLVVAIGQATKLVSYLTAQAKRYEATVKLGSATTTLDREGEVVATGPIPVALARELEPHSANHDEGPGALEAATRPHLERAIAVELTRHEQVPPAFSALKQNGRSVHERARRGEHVELAPRAVEVRRLEVVRTSRDTIDLVLDVSKGYYVRALARDLGESLGVPAHLSSLRRVASGPFTLDEALPADATREALVQALQPLARSAGRVLPLCTLSPEGTERARHGQALASAHFAAPPATSTSAWLDPGGELVAIGRADDTGRFVVDRGFAQPTSSSAT
jgi:tRNA pseudouridine55 synthase